MKQAMQSNLIVQGITVADLVELFRLMIQSEVKYLKDEQPEKLLSPAETCKMFQPPISKVTLSSWTAKGLLQDYRIGGRVFYKQSEILEKLTVLKRYKN